MSISTSMPIRMGRTSTSTTNPGSHFQFINGLFSDELLSPRVSALNVLKYASGENPCAALLIEKNPHL